jgi:hypothetical protein
MWYNFRIMFSFGSKKKTPPLAVDGIKLSTRSAQMVEPKQPAPLPPQVPLAKQMKPAKPAKLSKKQAVGTETLSLIIDIESGLVRAALVLNKLGMPPRVIYTVSSPILNRVVKTHTGDLLGAMTKSLKEVTGIIANKAIPELRAKGVTLLISKVHCGLSSPWIISKTKSVKVDYGKDVLITKEMVSKIVDTDHIEMEKKFKAEHDASSDGAKLEYDLEFIEQKIFEIKLNGYPVTNFQGKHRLCRRISFVASSAVHGFSQSRDGPQRLYSGARPQ